MQRTQAPVRSSAFLVPLLLLALLVACQRGGEMQEAPPASYPEEPGEPARVESADESYGADGAGEAYEAEPADAPSTLGRSAAEPHGPRERAAPQASRAPRPAPERRPGLATHWGEARYSPAHEVDFERAEAARPAALVELHYNDRAGARRMLPGGHAGSAEANALGLHVRVLDARGRPLPALVSRDRVVGMGEPGERYALSIESSTGARFEVVASVDGLDVIDGEDASFAKRGYLLGPYGRVLIDGFRRSSAEVAAFRLGDVARSYAASKGKARNVGVIGVAIFAERRPVFEPEPWRDPLRIEDTRLRQSAEPFPARFARPPVW